MEEVKEPKPGEADLEELLRTMPAAMRRRYFNGGEIDVVGLCMWIWRAGSRIGWNSQPVKRPSGGNAVVPRMLRDHLLKRRSL